MAVSGGAIFWPIGNEEGVDLIGASDHRLVWMDLVVTPLISEAVRGLAVGIEAMDVVLNWESAAGTAYEVEVSEDLETWGPSHRRKRSRSSPVSQPFTTSVPLPPAAESTTG